MDISNGVKSPTYELYYSLDDDLNKSIDPLYHMRVSGIALPSALQIKFQTTFGVLSNSTLLLKTAFHNTSK